MMNETCQTCKYFRQHYIKMGRRYNAIGDGHCVKPRLKIRKTRTPACGYYQPREQP